MGLTYEDVVMVSEKIPNLLYRKNIQATEELIDLFDAISGGSLRTSADYVRMYDDNFYTYQTWDELVESESDGLTEEELLRELEDGIHGSIWMLPCGWYVQYV